MEITIPFKEENQAPFYAKLRPLIIERSNKLDTNKDQSSKIVVMSEWFDFSDEYRDATEEGYSNAWVEPKWETEVFADSKEEAINKVKDWIL